MFWPTYTSTYNSPTSWNPGNLMVHIQAPDPTFATKCECEVLCIFETLGYGERGCEPRARDVVEATESISLLQSSCRFHGDIENYRYSLPYDAM